MAGSAVGLAAVPQLKELLHRPELASGVTRVGEVLRRIDDVAKRVRSLHAHLNEGLELVCS